MYGMTKPKLPWLVKIMFIKHFIKDDICKYGEKNEYYTLENLMVSESNFRIYVYALQDLYSFYSLNRNEYTFQEILCVIHLRNKLNGPT